MKRFYQQARRLVDFEVDYHRLSCKYIDHIRDLLIRELGNLVDNHDHLWDPDGYQEEIIEGYQNLAHMAIRELKRLERW